MKAVPNGFNLGLAGKMAGMSTEITLKEFANALFSSLPDGNYVLLSESGLILEAFASKANPWGIDQESIGKSFHDLLPESLET